LKAHTLDGVLANSPAQRDPRSDLRSHLLQHQPVSLVGRPGHKGHRLRFPHDLEKVPIVLPSLESEVRIAFDRLLDEAVIHPIIQAEVDDMAMMRVIARKTRCYI